MDHGRFAQGYDTLRRDALIEGLKVARFFKRRRLHHCFERAKPLPKVSEASDAEHCFVKSAHRIDGDKKLFQDTYEQYDNIAYLDKTLIMIRKGAQSNQDPKTATDLKNESLTAFVKMTRTHFSKLGVCLGV